MRRPLSSTLVTNDRQFFKSECGLGEPLRTTRQNDISYSFCRFVVEGGKPFIVENAASDPRVQYNPAVTELGIAAYLGMPIYTIDGCVLGSLCAVQMTPRSWTANDKNNLSDLADAVSRELELSERDLTAQKAITFLENRSRMLERDLRNTAHDLRTPAGAISSCIELISLNGDPVQGDDTQELLDICKDATTNLLDMIDQLLVEAQLAGAGAHVPKMRPVSASALLRRVTRMARMIAEEAKVKFELVWPEELIFLMVDEALVERVMLNLITNAVKYSPEGESIEIRLEREGSFGSAECRVTINDHGPGVPEDERDHIFGEFSKGSKTSEHRQTSFGLGLSFCKNAVDSHKGRIGINEAPGGGASFYCVLPCLPAEKSCGDTPP